MSVAESESESASTRAEEREDTGASARHTDDEDAMCLLVSCRDADSVELYCRYEISSSFCLFVCLFV